MITTSMVFIFVLIASVFFLLADKLIEQKKREQQQADAVDRQGGGLLGAATAIVRNGLGLLEFGNQRDRKSVV